MDVSETSRFVLAMLAPTLLAGAGLMLPRTVRAARRQVKRRRVDDVVQPGGPPIEHLAADVRRLLQRHEAVRQSTGMAMRARHLRALEAAIGDCATLAARALGLPCPDRPVHGPLPTPELRRLLRALADAGLVLVPGSELLAADGHG